MTSSSDLPDLIYYYLDFLDQLGLRDLPLVGHGLGGMFAAELAAVQPERFSSWCWSRRSASGSGQDPVEDFFALPPAELATAALPRPDSPAAVAAATIPTEGDEMIEYHVERAKSMATAAKYLWPIPNRGLASGCTGCGADADRLGGGRRDRAAGLRRGLSGAVTERPGGADRGGRPSPDAGAAGAAG